MSNFWRGNQMNTLYIILCWFNFVSYKPNGTGPSELGKDLGCRSALHSIGQFLWVSINFLEFLYVAGFEGESRGGIHGDRESVTRISSDRDSRGAGKQVIGRDLRFF